MNPIPWSRSTLEELRKIKGVCLDIDDTLSSHGKLTARAFDALWRLKGAGFAVVPITGRPAGWCDHIARFWPVDAVVVENGATVFYMKEGKRLRIDTPGAPRAKDRIKKLTSLRRKIEKAFPGVQVASDQAYREYDLAIDFCEAVKPWPRKKIEKLVEVCKKSGAQAKVSSIHVNAWFGRYDKFSGFQNWAKKGYPGLSTEPLRFDEWIFIGDSPNDEPLFEKFHRSIGVANLKNFLSDIRSTPTWLTEAESGDGFAEMADKLIEARVSG